MRIKEPKKLVAAILLVYILLSTAFIIKEIIDKKENAAQFTGRGSVGMVNLRLVSLCSIDLKQEFNLISICANTTDMSITNLLSPIAGKYDFILRWNKTSQDFDVYSPEAYENPFNILEINQSYLIYMKQNEILTISGDEIGDLNISLVSEYNPPGYPYTFTTNISKYIDPISNNISFILKWNTTTQEFDVYSPEAYENQFEKIKKGEGQLIYMVIPETLRYNKTLLQSG